MTNGVKVLPGLICASCNKVHLNPSQKEFSIARAWGFFLCGMVGQPHAGEDFVRTTVIVNDKRIHLLSGKEVHI